MQFRCRRPAKGGLKIDLYLNSGDVAWIRFLTVPPITWQLLTFWTLLIGLQGSFELLVAYSLQTAYGWVSASLLMILVHLPLLYLIAQKCLGIRRVVSQVNFVNQRHRLRERLDRKLPRASNLCSNASASVQARAA